MQLRDQDDSTLMSPFPGVGEVPWPRPGSTQLAPVKPSDAQEVNEVQSHSQHISMEWKLINKRFSAANITGIQHEDIHDWCCFTLMFAHCHDPYGCLHSLS
jgi:hypothetical protein